MFLRIFLLLLLLACAANESAFAQVEVFVALAPKSNTASQDDDSMLTENYDLVITILNNSPDSIEVPGIYVANQIRLCASGSRGTRWPLCLISSQVSGVQGAKKNKGEDRLMVTLAPGGKHEVLRVGAKESILSPGDNYSLHPAEEFVAQRWVWTWTAHPGPDYSPFESRKGDRRSDTAVLWCELDIGRQTIRSIPLIVNAKHYDGG